MFQKSFMPVWGGFFEICVKLVKRCLKKVLGNAKLSYEELESVLIETESVLNSRALTYVYEELSEDPLTPSHLVIGRRLLDKPTASTESLRTMARREKLLRGREDVVRAAEVVTVDNSLRQVRLKRPIQKLYPLEVNARDEDPVSVVGASVHPGSRNIQVVRDEDIPAVTIAT